MLNENELHEIQKITEELLAKIQASDIVVAVRQAQFPPQENAVASADIVTVDIQIKEPHMVIGQGGQSLMSLQRIAGIIAGRRLKKVIYLQFDINDYKKEKIKHLQSLAQDAANEAVRSALPKTLPPMPSYDRRIIHAELAQRTGVITQSHGEGEQRFIIVHPR